MTDSPMNVCIMGAALDTGNMGVSALGTSLVTLALGQQPDARIFFFVGRREEGLYHVRIGDRQIRIPVVNFRLSPKAQPGEHLFGLLLMAATCRMAPFPGLRKALMDRNPRLKAIAEAGFVGDIRGGDSFSDIYGLWGMIAGSLPSVIALLLKKDLVLFPQTYGPYKSRTAQCVARFILRRSRIILSRDKEGLQVVTYLLGGAPSDGRLRFCPDVAFALESRSPDPVPVQPVLDPCHTVPTVGLNVSGLLYNGGFTKDNMFGLSFDYRHFVRALAEKILSGTDARLLLVPHTFAPKGHVESDPEACEDLFRSLAPLYPDRVHVVNKECGPSEIKGVIGLCDFFVGSRMHACIGALSQGIPTVGVAYSRKFQGVFESVGAGHLVVDARRGTEEQAIEAVLSAYRRLTEEKRIILERVGTARKLLGRTFCELLGGPLQDETAAGAPGTRRNVDLQELERAGAVARD